MTTQKKITLSTFKSFIRKNAGKALIRVDSTFDGMVDGCVETEDRSFTPLVARETVWDNNLGFYGIKLVLGSRDYFRAYSDENHEGIEVFNCIGSFIVAIKKEAA